MNIVVVTRRVTNLKKLITSKWRVRKKENVLERNLLMTVKIGDLECINYL